jgi:hypothetical protein
MVIQRSELQSTVVAVGPLLQVLVREEADSASACYDVRPMASNIEDI